MCLHPIFVKNPLFCKSRYYSQDGITQEMDKRFYNSTDEFIEVACGKCEECRSSHFSALLQRCLVECRTSYLYFVTLTYDDKHIPSVTLPNGKVVLYTDYADVQLLIKRVRNTKLIDRDWRYLVALEYGDQYSRPHVHMLFFISKNDFDEPNTPFIYEGLLRDNLRKLWARNVGTRKHPVYEPLFTYACRMTTFGLRSNYFVQYVYRDTTATNCLSEYTNTGHIKAIRYLIGYVNKGSRFDKTIESYLSDLDPLLSSSLKRLLSSRVVYSKGLGSGFDTSQSIKVNLQPIFRQSSLVRFNFTKFCDTTPHTFIDFVEQEPYIFSKLILFISSVPSNYGSFRDLDSALAHFTSNDDFICHFALLKYFPHYFSLIYRRYFRDFLTPTISYLFRFIRTYSYATHRVYTADSLYCDSYLFIRRSVDESILSKVPFLGFNLEGEQKFIGLCKYYRERCTTLDDVDKMYSACGFKSYKEWKKSFDLQLDISKANRVQSNNFTHFIDDSLKNQKSSLYLCRNLKGVDLYTTVL